jgi:hypothetical protein
LWLLLESLLLFEKFKRGNGWKKKSGKIHLRVVVVVVVVGVVVAENSYYFY